MSARVSGHKSLDLLGGHLRPQRPDFIADPQLYWRKVKVAVTETLRLPMAPSPPRRSDVGNGAASSSNDPILSAFARELDDSCRIIDLRRAKPGDGFSWGRYGPNTRLRRFGMRAVFAYQKRRGLVSRLLGRAG